MSARVRPSLTRDSGARRRGVVIVYASVFMVALIGIISLAVDWGRVQTAKTQLQDATDAAARYAAAGLYDGTYVAKAQAAALQNSVDGTALAIYAADVSSGYWNVAARTFTAGGTPVNAVRVVGRRTSALGTAVPLVFGRVIGKNDVDVTATSIARQSGLAVAAVQTLTLTGSAKVQRKTGEAGGVAVAANTNLTTGPMTVVGGDLLYYTTLTASGSNTGRSTTLASSFAYATPTVPGGVTTYPSVYLTSGTNPVAGSFYVSGDLYCGGTANIALYSDCYIYCGGNATFDGGMTVTPNGFRLFVYSVGSGTITYTNTNPLPAIVYAPNSPVVMTGPGALTGSVVGKTVSIATTLNYTATHAIPFKPTGGGDPMAAGGVMQMK